MEKVIKFRRDLHQMAETDFLEWLTFDYILETLKDIKAQFKFLDISPIEAMRYLGDIKEDCFYRSSIAHDAILPVVKITFNLNDEGVHTAIRCDLDGLPIEESVSYDHKPFKLNFRSKKNMHACGHDAHMAITLNTILWVNEHLEYLKKTSFKKLSFIFQCAEEGCRGARIVCASSLLDDIDELYGFHIGMGLKTGFLAPKVNEFLATEKFTLEFYGKKAHAGKFYEGVNVLPPMCKIIDKSLNLIDKEKMLLCNFSNIKVLGSANIIPDFASLSAEIRAKTESDLEEFKEKISKIVKDTGVILANKKPDVIEDKVVLVCHVTGQGLPIDPCEKLYHHLKQALDNTDCLNEYPTTYPFKASEDCSLLIKKVQEHGGVGTYFLLGSNIKAPHHNSQFDIDEESLNYGAKFMQKLLLTY